MSNKLEKRLLVGKINGLFGIKGWVKVFSYTDPKEKITTYKSWLLKSDNNFQKVNITSRKQGKTVIAKIADIDSIEQAEKLLGTEVYISSLQLPKLTNEYYYYQLEGLEVINTEQKSLGRVTYLFNNGNHTVVATAGAKERMIPFIKPYLISVDMDKKIIVMDWDIDF